MKSNTALETEIYYLSDFPAIRRTSERETRGKKHIFSEQEKKDFADQLTAVIKRIDDLEAEKKKLVEDYKQRINSLELEKKDTADSYRIGYVIRDCLCDMYLDLEGRERVFVDPETLAVVCREPMKPEDHKLKLEIARFKA